MPTSNPANLVEVLLEDETIRAAAVLCHDGTIFEAPAHWGAAMAANRSGKAWSQEDLGFVTNEGRYVTRDEAELIALRANQLKPDITDPTMIHAADFEWMK